MTLVLFLSCVSLTRRLLSEYLVNSGMGIQVCDKVSLSRPANNVNQSPGGAVIVASPTPPIFLTFQLMERSAAFGSLLSGIPL